MSVFIIDIKELLGKGLEIKPLRAMINHNTTEVFIESLQVRSRILIGDEGSGFRYILDSMNAERILVASEAIGDGRWFIKRASQYASERTVFERKLVRTKVFNFRLLVPMLNLKPRRSWCEKQRRYLRRAGPAEPKPTWRSFLVPRPPGTPAKRHCKHMVDLDLPLNTMLNESGAKLDYFRSHRFRRSRFGVLS